MRVYFDVEENIVMEKVIISLTSYPARITMVHQVIESLWNQTQKADEIVLWLAMEEFPNQEVDLPDKLKNMLGKNGFHIKWVSGNLKSHKKYFYALQAYNDSIVITVDDDVRYHNKMVSTLICSYKRHPNAVSARRVRIIFRGETKLASYMTWFGKAGAYIDAERMDLCAIGVGGVLYPPGCWHNRWFDEKHIRELAENQDDLWLKFNQMIDNIPVVCAGDDEGDEVIEEAQTTALCLQNSIGGENDKCITRMTQWIVETQRNVYEKWFSALMFPKEYVVLQERYYHENLKKFGASCKKKNIYIVGAGKYAKIIYQYIKESITDNLIKAFVVSDSQQNCIEIDGIPIIEMRKISESEENVYVCGVSDKYKQEMKTKIQNENHQWIEFDISGMIILNNLKEEISNM